MDDFKSILEKHLMSKQSKHMFNKGARLVGNNSENFEILIDFLVEGDTSTKQRAASVLGRIGQRHPHLLTKHFNAFMNLLQDNSQHNAVHRAIARSYQYYTLSEDEQGIFFEIGMMQLQNYQAAIAVKAFLIKSLHNIAVQHSSLKREFNLVLDELRIDASAGMQSRIKTYYFKDI